MLTSSLDRRLPVDQWLTSHSAEDHDIGEGLRENFSARGRWNSAITVRLIKTLPCLLAADRFPYSLRLWPSAEGPGDAVVQAGRHRQRRALDPDFLRRRRRLHGHG